MTRFLAAPLDRLPKLSLEEPNFDAIREARAGELARRMVEEGFGYDVQSLETDPLTLALARAGGTREMLLLARRNDAVRAVMLATAWGAFLDHLGAGQTPAVTRKPLAAEPRDFALFPEDWEGDDDFRLRIQLAPETLSAAGPEGAYLAYALAVPGVKMVGVWAPMSFDGTIEAPFTRLGEVHVPVVAAAGNGAAPAALVAAVQAELRPKDRRPVGDFVTASAAEIVPYRVEAVLRVPSADGGLVKAQAEMRLARRAARQHRPGGQQLIEQIKAAAYVTADDGTPLVERVTLIAPLGDVNGVPMTPATPEAAYRAPYCTEIVVRVEGIDD